MAVIYNAAVRTDRMDVVLAAIDADASPGTLNLYSSGPVLLISFVLDQPAGAVSGDVLTFTTPIQAIAVATGTPVSATIADGTGTVVVSGLTVGTSGTNIIVSEPTTTIGLGGTFISGTLTHNTSGT